MKQYDLSVLITARNEEFLARTVEDVLNKRRANTEVIVILDGGWANPPVVDHPDVTVIYHPKSIGQRAGINQAGKLSIAKYIMKLDAHCIVDEGFDVKLMADCEYDWTVIPMMYNLHAFDWVCKSCEWKKYQSPTPKECPKCKGEVERKIIWKIRKHKRTEFMRFDSTLHFHYHGRRKKHPEAKGDIADTMSFIGACWFMHKEWWDYLEGLDEKHGSWGQVGTEIACKTWLAGGSLKVNKKTWFSHLFRTQGGDFGFPYPQSGNQVGRARKYCRDMWFHNKWPKQVRPLSWLVEKFGPLTNGTKDGNPDWHADDGKKRLEMVNAEGDKFYKAKGIIKPARKLTKGIIYYTDNQLKMRIARKCRKHITEVGLPIVSTSLKPLDFGKNIRMKMKRGYEAYFKQILTALENIDTDIVFLCEHDFLYHPSHFEFTPPDKDTFYYNWNWWRLRASDGLAVRYDTQLVPGLVAYRKILLEYYRQVVSHLEKVGFTGDNARKVGYEPGTHKRVEFAGKYKVERFDSEYPIIDIRHGANLTTSKWKQEDFRSQKNCQNWQTTFDLPGWGKTSEIIKQL